jgi:hypothetical protein
MLQLTLPPDRTPSIQPYARTTSLTVGASITGTAVAGRATLYNFNVSGLADGDYVVDVLNPYGRFMLRKSGTNLLIADEWWELDANPNTDPGKVLVDEDYGGTNNLTYEIDGVPVADASIEIFLDSAYTAGNRDSTYRIATSRQTAAGNWAAACYLDPDTYVVRYYRNGVAGPDSYRLVVSLDPSEIVVTPLTSGGSANLRLHRSAAPAPLTAIHPVYRTVAVNQDYGGTGNLVYKVNGKPVDGATLQVFKADDYKGGQAIASAQQGADGTWTNTLQLTPGRYVLHCFKKNVAGPNSYTLTVE